MKTKLQILRNHCAYIPALGNKAEAAMQEYAEQYAIEFCLHIVGKLKFNPENKPSYDENSNEAFLITLPGTIHKRLEQYKHESSQRAHTTPG